MNIGMELVAIALTFGVTIFVAALLAYILKRTFMPGEKQ